MKAKWAASVCAVALIFGLSAVGQENGSSNDPILKTRPNDRSDKADRNTPPSAAYPGPAKAHTNTPPSAAHPEPRNPTSTYGAPPNAKPDGSRFIIKLKDTLDPK